MADMDHLGIIEIISRTFLELLVLFISVMDSTRFDSDLTESELRGIV